MIGSYGYVIAALLMLLQVGLGLNFMAVTPLFPIVMEELKIDRATVSLLFSVVPIAQALFTVPAGMIATRFGVARTLAVGAVAMSAGLLSLFIPSFEGLLVSRVIFGLGTGLLVPLLSSVVVQWFMGGALPVMNGLGLVFGSIGVSSAFFITVPLSELLGWRGVLAAYGGYAGVMAIAWILLGREGRAHQHSQEAGQPVGVLDVLRRPTTYWLALAFSGPIAYYDVLVAWLPTYYNQVFAMDLAQAAAITGLLGLTGIPGSLSGSLLSARVGLRRPFLMVPGACMGLVGLGTFLVDATWVNVSAILLVGLLLWAYPPVLFTIPMELPGLSPPVVAVVGGMILTLAGVAAFFAPLVAGFLTDTTGSYLPGFLLFTVCSLSLLVAALKLPETGPRGRREAAPAADPGAGQG